jgi:predicted histidine transporter YuiF (NhaC family)
MGLVYDFVRVGIIWFVTFIYQRIMIGFLEPGTTFYEIAAGASNVNGAEFASTNFQVAVVWIPVIVYAFGLLYILIRIYRRQVVTASTGRARP